MPMPSDLHPRDPHDRAYAVLGELVDRTEYLLRVPSAWDGRVWVAPPPPGRLERFFGDQPERTHARAVANPDHSLTIRADLLRDIDKAARGIAGGATLQNYDSHQAIMRFVHVAVRLSRDDLVGVPVPDDGIEPDRASLALAAGLARSWAMDNVNTVISLADLDAVSPRLTAARRFDEMPHVTAAARALVKDLAAQAGRPLDVTHRDLVSAPQDQRWNVIGDWMIDRNLTGLIDDRRRAEVRPELARIAHDTYAEVAWIPDRVADMPTAKPDQRAVLSARMTAKGKEVGERTVLQLNIRIKGLQINWGAEQEQAAAAAPSADQVRAAAVELGVPVDRLRSFLAGTADPTGAARPATGAEGGGASTGPRQGSRDRTERGTGPR